MWLGCRLAAAALIQPLAWALPYVMGAALKRKKGKRKERKKPLFKKIAEAYLKAKREKMQY